MIGCATIINAATAGTLRNYTSGDALKNIQTGFLKNVGQIYDSNKKLCPYVFYRLQLNNIGIFITNSGITYSMLRCKNGTINDSKIEPKTVGSINDSIYGDISRLDMTLVGASIEQSKIIERDLDVANGIINFYSSGLGDEALGLRYCKSLLIKNVYPNIDWKIIVDREKGIKYEFIVHPGGEVSKIKISYEGAKAITLNESKNEFTITTPIENISEGKLICFTSTNNSVKAKYVLRENLISIKVETYNKTEDLTIDPAVTLTRTWSTYFGGTLKDQCNSVKIDLTNEFIYVVGKTNSTDFPILNNGTAFYQSNVGFAASNEAYISCFYITGVQLWCTYLFSTENEEATDVTVDNDGNIYVVGWTQSYDNSTKIFPLQKFNSGYFQNYSFPSFHGFVTRFDINGKLQWSTYFGGLSTSPLEALITSVVCDSKNHVFVAGYTASSALPVLSSNIAYFQPTINGTYDAFIAAFDQGTNQLWTTYFGGDDFEEEPTVKCIAEDNIILCGITTSFNNFPVVNKSGAYNQSTNNSNQFGGYGWDGFVCIFKNTWAQDWCTYFGGGGDDFINDCDVEVIHNSFTICGDIYNQNGTGFPFYNPGGGAYYDNVFQTPVSFNTHGFLCKFSSGYAQQWCTLFAGNGTDNATAVAIGDGGNIFLAGDNSRTGSVDLFPLYNPGTPFYYDGNLSNSGYYDAYLAMFNSSLQRSWCTYYGTNDPNEHSSEIDVAGPYTLWVGYTDNANQPSAITTVHEPGGFDNTANTGYEGIIAKFYDHNVTSLRFSAEESGNTTLNDIRIVYDNFSDNIIYLEFNEGVHITTSKIFIIDSKGARSPVNFTARQNCIEIDLTGLCSGLYLLNIISSDSLRTLKFIKR